MTSSLTHRLESWRALLRNGGPDWLVEQAPRIIRQLEAEIAASGMEAPSGGETEGLDLKGDSPTAASSGGDAHTLSGGG